MSYTWLLFADRLLRWYRAARWSKYWVQEFFRRLRRRPKVEEFGDPWAEQRARPGAWVALADAARKGG